MPPEVVSNPPVPLMPVDDRPIDPPVDVWTPTPPTNLIFDDGEPLETHRHRLAMNVLIDAVNQALKDRTDFFAGGNMFIYFSDRKVFNKDFRGPDFL